MQSDTITPNTDDDAPVWGCEAIGLAIGLTERQARHLLSTGQIPGKKVGHTWVSTKRKLREVVTPDAVEAA
jgi:hypothetical protein